MDALGRWRRARQPARAAAAGAALLACSLLASAAAAGSARVEAAGGGGGGFPVTVASPYGPVRLAGRPDRIVSLSPTATEMLFAIHAGRQVVAVDQDSDYPPSAPRTALSGYTPNVEAIAAERPDLVVISYNPKPPDLVSALHLLGVPVLDLPAASNLAGSYAEIAELGEVTGQRKGAEAVVSSMRAEIARLLAGLPRRTPRPTYFYELDPTLYTATADTFVGSVLSLAGLRDITGASVHGSDYPQLGAEAVLRANPTFVLLADGATVASVARRPGWAALGAVRHHRVIELDEDIASRWGPRIVDLLRTVLAAVRSLAPTGSRP